MPFGPFPDDDAYLLATYGRTGATVVLILAKLAWVAGLPVAIVPSRPEYP